jgi:hypothetical protein
MGAGPLDDLDTVKALGTPAHDAGAAIALRRGNHAWQMDAYLAASGVSAEADGYAPEPPLAFGPEGTGNCAAPKPGRIPVIPPAQRRDAWRLDYLREAAGRSRADGLNVHLPRRERQSPSAAEVERQAT